MGDLVPALLSFLVIQQYLVKGDELSTHNNSSFLKKPENDDTIKSQSLQHKSAIDIISPPGGKSIGAGYGYDADFPSGPSNDLGNNGYEKSLDHDHDFYSDNVDYTGHNGNYNYGYGNGRPVGKQGRLNHGNHGFRNSHQKNKFVPIEIPYISKDGCTYPGEPVCRRNAAGVPNVCSYRECLLASESVNLWKKPTLVVRNHPCSTNGRTNRGVLPDFCNESEILLKAVGWMKQGHDNMQQIHQKNYFMDLNPCILQNTACP